MMHLLGMVSGSSNNGQRSNEMSGCIRACMTDVGLSDHLRAHNPAPEDVGRGDEGGGGGGDDDDDDDDDDVEASTSQHHYGDATTSSVRTPHPSHVGASTSHHNYGEASFMTPNPFDVGGSTSQPHYEDASFMTPNPFDVGGSTSQPHYEDASTSYFGTPHSPHMQQHPHWGSTPVPFTLSGITHTPGTSYQYGDQFPIFGVASTSPPPVHYEELFSPTAPGFGTHGPVFLYDNIQTHQDAYAAIPEPEGNQVEPYAVRGRGRRSRGARGRGATQDVQDNRPLAQRKGERERRPTACGTGGISARRGIMIIDLRMEV